MGDPAFRTFWLGQTVSLLGSQITFLALPFTAILVLDATPLQMGVLGAVEFAPFLFLTLLAGAWIDRVRRRPVLVAANLLRAVLIGLVPLAALAGVLSMPLLAGIALAAGCCAVCFEVAFLAYVPSLVGRERLTGANARLFASASAADVAGPGLAGVLVSLVGAPLALAADALSYLVSGVSLVTIRRPEPTPDRPGHRTLRAEIAEGLRATFGHPLLRAFALEAATFNLFVNLLNTAFLLFLTRELGFSPTAVGAILAVGALGSLAGSVVAGRIAARLGLGVTILAAMVVACSVYLVIPFLGGPLPVAGGALAIVLALAGAGISVTVIHVMTIRQTVTPDRLLARMNASYRTLGYGLMPIGSLLGGIIGETVGLRAALLVGAIGIASAPLWVVVSPLARVRRLDDLRISGSPSAPVAAPGDAALGLPSDAG